ncbi:MAG: hypothetical protein ACRC33_08415 [Gemmataceae bacterium]
MYPLLARDRPVSASPFITPIHWYRLPPIVAVPVSASCPLPRLQHVRKVMRAALRFAAFS